uniref:Uncharacterized protein n=1 Tax=Setaria viridis TaxID=4556 RepID=A0A4U6VIT5_SETVI|nr:hypothetical protein SEVIR_3G397401v2 [Setaria viridis]
MRGGRAREGAARRAIRQCCCIRCRGRSPQRKGSSAAQAQAQRHPRPSQHAASRICRLLRCPATL